MPSVACFFCFHNRKSVTTSFAKRLLAQANLYPELELKWLALDDGSSDGTSDSLKELIPEISLYSADGSWFWAKSMAFLYQKALELRTDYLLLLNDDVMLEDGALPSVFKDLASVTNESVIIGKTYDLVTKEWTYGGICNKHPFFPLWFHNGNPGDKLTRVQTLHANFVLVPFSVAKRVPFFGGYSHAFGDIDFGLRLTKAGVSLYQSSQYVGSCSRNSDKGTWMDDTLPFRKRLSLVNTRKGMPWKDRLLYTWRNGGVAWLWFFLSPYIKFVKSGLRRL